MKKSRFLLSMILLLFFATEFVGIGYRFSGSAGTDLKEALVSLHGMPYTGRAVENGTEDMSFSVEPDTFFLTNYHLRHFLGLDYRYKCKVTYRVYSEGSLVSERTVCYVGIDPMGPDKQYLRAYLVPDS